MATDLHSEALQAEQHLEALATGLAKAGVEERIVDTVSSWAKGARTIAAQLGKGQERTADDEPPAEEKPQPGHTMQSATEDLHRDAQAAAQQRAGGY